MRSHAEVVVRVGAQVKGQVTVGLRRQLTVVGVDPSALQNRQLKLPERQNNNILPLPSLARVDDIISV